MFQRAAADGPVLPAGPDQHRRADLTRRRSRDLGHDHPRHRAMRRDGLREPFAVETHAAPRARFTAARTASAVAGACKSG
jgi:hypothetical protein